jgi:Tfp pilus assembly protein PilO
MMKYRAALIALATAAALYLLVISPIDKSRERIRAELPQKQASLEKYRDFINKYSEEKERMDIHRQDLSELESFIVPESDPTLATASIQSRVQDIAASAGIKVNSIRALTPLPERGYSRLPVFVDGRGSMKNISSLLKMVDSSPEMLAVEKLEISSTRLRGQLRIKIQLAGMMRNE